ncbi:MAG: sigma-70 family RNA polymerase sigma factor [Candidatus Omnitrophica bacterium]|nr:sigma-70 family RNA polymerase sigma factor [Candidatus Omnitrophota bacterium]
MDPIRLYLKDIKEIPLLNAEEEVRLAQRIKRGDSQARKMMIIANLRLVINIAKRYSHLGVPLLDLVEEGNLGLMKAVTKFNPKRGFRFSTYAAWWIRQYITRAIANQGKTVRVPVYMTELLSRWRKMNMQLTQQLGRKPELTELAKHLRLPMRKVKQLGELTGGTTSLDAPVGEEGSAEVIDLFEDTNALSPADELQRIFSQEHIHILLQQMNAREREVLILRFGLKDGLARTLGETAKKFGITRERVRQIEGVALKKLRVLIAEEEGRTPKPEVRSSKLDGKRKR